MGYITVTAEVDIDYDDLQIILIDEDDLIDLAIQEKFKQTMRMFWTDKWKHQRTPEEWVDALHDEAFSSKSQRDLYRYVVKATLFSGIDKLVLERKLLKQQAKNLKEMLSSPDKENALVAVTIMAVLKPRKFKKLIKQEIKNTETNE